MIEDSMKFGCILRTPIAIRRDFNKMIEDRLPASFLIGKDKYCLNNKSFPSTAAPGSYTASGSYGLSTSVSPFISTSSLVHIKNYLQFINSNNNFLNNLYIELYESAFTWSSDRGMGRIMIIDAKGSTKSIQNNKYKYIISLSTGNLPPIPPYDNILHFLIDWVLNEELFSLDTISIDLIKNLRKSNIPDSIIESIPTTRKINIEK